MVAGRGPAVLGSLPRAFSLAILDPMARAGRSVTDDPDPLAVVDAWLTPILHVLKPDHHLFIFCPHGQGADLELCLCSRHLPIQSRVIWHHADFTVQRSPIGLLNTWSLILHIGTHGLQLTDAPDRRAPFSDVQPFATRDAVGDHVPKPIELVRWLVSIGSQPGDGVLDVCGGDSVTAAVCEQLGRHCTVIERDPARATAFPSVTC